MLIDKEQLVGAGSFVLAGRFQGANSGHQALLQAILYTKHIAGPNGLFKCSFCGVKEEAQLVKCLQPKPEDPSSNPNTQI